jgi:UDP-N-acetyl-2-amino-2-deoxyglucuronate dehydrogenase
MIHIAIIGCGVIAQYHLRALAKLTTACASAVCDVRAEVAQKTAAEFGVPRWSTSASELFADPAIDAVILALPAYLRTPLALEALRHGKHVLIEKPTAMNSGEIKQLIAARGQLIAACCTSRYRSFQSATVARDFIRTGGLGSLRTISCRAVTPAGAPPKTPPPVWRLRRDLNGGGIFVNWGCYDLDYLFGLLDFKLTPTVALARSWRVGPAFLGYAAPGSDAETHIAALVIFAEGCALTYERAEFSTLPKEHCWQITGERGTLTLVMTKATAANVVLTSPDASQGTVTRVLWEGDEASQSLEHDGVILDFVTAIEQQGRPRTTLEEAWLVTRVTDAIYSSAQNNVGITFD